MERKELLKQIEMMHSTIVGRPMDDADEAFFNRLSDEKLLKVVMDWEFRIENMVNERGMEG